MTTQKTKTVKGYKGLAMEGVIANWYAKNTLNDVSRHKGMAEKMAVGLKPGSRVLEVAPGPGYFSIELAKLGDFQVTGLDISQSFIQIAVQNAEKAGVKVDFKLGNASDMPFDANQFNLVFCQAAFKNFTQPVEAIAEMYRVLRPGGAAVIVDLRRDADAAEIDRSIRQMQVSPINALFTRITFSMVLLKNAHSIDEMQSYAARTPFGKGQMNLDGIGFQMRLVKK